MQPALVTLFATLSLCASLAASRGHFVVPLTAKQTKYRRRALLSTLTLETETVGLGAYFVPMSIGTPGQVYDALLDTGSGPVHLPCTDRGYQIPTFVSSYSTTYSKHNCTNKKKDNPCRTICGANFPAVACPTAGLSPQEQCSAVACACSSDSGACLFAMVYGDQSSASGSIGSDVAFLPGTSMKPIKLAFGCSGTEPNTAYSETVYKGDAPYLAGMSFQSSSLFRQLVDQSVVSATLGFCMGDGGYGEYTTAQSPGLLVLGDATVTSEMMTFNSKLIDPSAWSSPNDLKPPGLWMEVAGIRVGSEDAVNAVPSGPPVAMILDTGAAAMVLPDLFYQQFSGLLAYGLNKTQTSQDSGRAVQLLPNSVSVFSTNVLTPEELDAAFPTVYFEMGSVDTRVSIPIPPSKYLYYQGLLSGKAYYSTYIQSGGSSTGVASTIGIIGNTWLNHLFVQATQSTGQITLGRVAECSKMTFVAPPALPRRIKKNQSPSNA